MQKTVYYCDGCGKEKGEVNHWWVICRDWVTCRDPRSTLCIRPFGHISDQGTDRIYCGQQCAMKAVSEYMEACRQE